MRRSLAALLAAVFCLAPAAGASASASAIAPEALVPHLLEFPGFGLGEHTLTSRRSALMYARRVLEERPGVARREARLLERHGFVEGIQESFSAEHAAAVAAALVFHTSRGPRWELRRAEKEERGSTDFEASMADPTVPRAQAFTGSTHVHIREGGKRVVVLRRYVDLQFSYGRCFLAIGDALYGASTVEEAARGPIAAAAAVYARAKRLCGTAPRARR